MYGGIKPKITLRLTPVNKHPKPTVRKDIITVITNAAAVKWMQVAPQSHFVRDRGRGTEQERIMQKGEHMLGYSLYWDLWYPSYFAVSGRTQLIRNFKFFSPLKTPRTKPSYHSLCHNSINFKSCVNDDSFHTRKINWSDLSRCTFNKLRTNCAHKVGERGIISRSRINIYDKDSFNSRSNVLKRSGWWGNLRPNARIVNILFFLSGQIYQRISHTNLEDSTKLFNRVFETLNLPGGGPILA